MKVEEATRKELQSLPELVRSSALGEVALELARRLDSEPADTAAVLLARELRMALDSLRRRAPEDTPDEIEDFLARIATPDGSDAAY